MTIGAIGGLLGSIGGTLVNLSSPPATESYAAVVLADSPVGFYRLEEGSGVVAFDSSTSNNDAAYVGAPTYGIIGAVDNGVDAVSGSCIDAPTDFGSMSAATVEFWWKYTSQLYIFRDATALGGHGWYMSATVVKIGSLSRTLQNWPNIADGSWHHIALTTDGTTTTAYADGVSRDTWNGSWLTVTTAASPLRFGANGLNAGQWWPGAFDEIAIYDFELSSTRVAAHYAAA